MACSSVNGTDPVKKIEKALATKKQQSMSKSVLPFPLLEAIQDALFNKHGRVVSSSCHAVSHGRSVD